MRKARAVLIEDETMFLQLILMTLGKLKDLQVVGEFGLGQPGLKASAVSLLPSPPGLPR